MTIATSRSGHNATHHSLPSSYTSLFEQYNKANPESTLAVPDFFHPAKRKDQDKVVSWAKANNIALPKSDYKPDDKPKDKRQAEFEDKYGVGVGHSGQGKSDEPSAVTVVAKGLLGVIGFAL